MDDNVQSTEVAAVQYRDLLPAALVALAFVVAGVILALIFRTEPEPPSADAAVGKCLQAQRVLYQVDRGQAAEKCLALLDADGPERFIRTWQNYRTEPGSW